MTHPGQDGEPSKRQSVLCVVASARVAVLLCGRRVRGETCDQKAQNHNPKQLPQRIGVTDKPPLFWRDAREFRDQESDFADLQSPDAAAEFPCCFMSCDVFLSAEAICM